MLQDVIRTMYNPKFISELFRGQEVYSMHSTRQIFDRLAHSSIMRLNESSMDKLFDLMTMGFKYQLLACSYPEELLHVTLNHLAQLRSKVADAKVVVDLVDVDVHLVPARGARGRARPTRVDIVDVIGIVRTASIARVSSSSRRRDATRGAR